MIGSKLAFFLCASLALSMADPTDLFGGLGLGNLLSSADNLANGVVGTLVSDLIGLLGSVTTIVANLLRTLISVVNQIGSILNIPNGTDQLSFVQNLVSSLDPIVQQLLGTVSSGVGEVVDDVENVASDLTGELSQIVDQISKVSNVSVNNPVSTVQNLINSLSPLLTKLLDTVQQLVHELLKDVSNVSQDLLTQLVKTGGLFNSLLQLVGQPQAILSSLTKAGVQLRSECLYIRIVL